MSTWKNFNDYREKLHGVIFEAQTKRGKQFDIVLLLVIVASVIVVMLESVHGIQAKFGQLFRVLEWIFTIFFTIEYILRLLTIYKPWKYALSFYGIIDLLAVLPLYLSFVFSGAQYLLAVRILRLLRVFRILKLSSFMRHGHIIVTSLRASREKIGVFLYFVLLVVTLMGSIIYVIENPNNPSFSSIPRSIYWAIVTVTTVGYGDITPTTNLGQFIAAMLMITGYAVIAVPTGIISSEMMMNSKNDKF